MKATMISSRYAVPVLLLLCLAAVPTVIHSYIERPASDGRSAAAIPMQLDGQFGRPSGRRPTWGAERFGSDDWIERRYPGPAQIVLFVGRSLDAKRLYHHPELLVSYGTDYGPATTVQLPMAPGVPVRVLRGSDAGSRRVGMYALRYDDRYVANPILFQLRNSAELLFTRRKPMTLFFVAQLLASEDQPVDTSPGAAMLAAALQAFERQGPARDR